MCVQPRQLGCQLPAFAAERRDAGRRSPLLSIDNSCPQAVSSKPAARRIGCRTTGQRDGRTDAQPLHKPFSVYYAGAVNNGDFELYT